MVPSRPNTWIWQRYGTAGLENGDFGGLNIELYTWWFIPLSKWVITLVISRLTPLIPFITRVITHLLNGMNHQVSTIYLLRIW